MTSTRAPLVGRRVMLQGLTAKPELNGRGGVAFSFDANRGRYQVRVHGSGATLSVKPSNLALDQLIPDAVVTGVPTAMSIAGNASPWAIDRIRSVVGSQEPILAVWQISKRNRSNLGKQSCTPFLFPLCWPAAVCCAPCVCAMFDTISSVHGATIYALTQHDIIRWVEADPLDGTCMGIPLVDQRLYASGALPLALVSSIKTRIDDDVPTAACDGWCPTQQVVLSVPPGHDLANARSTGVRYHDRMLLYIEESEAAATIIQGACDTVPSDAEASILTSLGLGTILPEVMIRSAATDAQEALETLGELREMGLITEAEYREKREQVLAALVCSATNR